MDEPEVYLDANVFIYAVLGSPAEAAKAQNILSRVAAGEMNAFTATLTVDEVLWVIQKHAGRAAAAKAADVFFITPHLHLLEVTEHVAGTAVDLYRTTPLNPRDAVHLATMKAKKLRTMLSTDPDFDGMAGIKRIDFLQN